MSTVDNVSNLPYIDKDRMVAAGASYGGYMIDWMLGHTDRFKALVTHAGVYDLRSEAGSTEELWFVKWEFQGFPWENPEMYDKFSPSRFAKKFKTPTLVTHGEIDYRIPISQAQQLFTALQQQKIPSKLVQFPDEGPRIVIREIATRMAEITDKGISDLMRQELSVSATIYTMVVLGLADFGNIITGFAGLSSGMGIFGISKYLVVPIGAAAVWALIVR